MRRDPEPAALSEDERRILALIEADLDLGGAGLGDRCRRRVEAEVARHRFLPLAAVVAGGLLMVATFATSLLLATLGAVLMATGFAAGAPRARGAARGLAGALGWWVEPPDRPPSRG